MPQIKVQTTIRAPLQTVFDAARDVELHTKTTAHTREEVVGGRREGLFELGDEVTFEATHFFVRQRLSARIVEMNAPKSFSDEMLRGAFQKLRHEHRFEVAESGTRMIDVLTWASPLGALGKVADALFLKRYMKQFLQRRNRELKRLVEEQNQL
jgi:ligand-binding SRPBCC domain-containing protein